MTSQQSGRHLPNETPNARNSAPTHAAIGACANPTHLTSRPERRRCSIPGRLECAGGSVDCVISNVSLLGIAVELNDEVQLDIGAPVRITVGPAGDVRAFVRWRKGACLGAECKGNEASESILKQVFDSLA